jgi:putative CocE/NonD family hydrolase
MHRSFRVLVATLILASVDAIAAQPSTFDARFDIRDDVLIKTPDGATLSAAVIKPRSATGRLSTLLKFDIYVRADRTFDEAKFYAEHGYAVVLADARGKRLSPDSIVPYETEARDTHAVLDWITKQSWSDGRVGMWGGSYQGFTAWAATKRMHPALKTIAVSAAAIPGLGLPMYNNVFLNANYAWAFHVSNNKFTDESVYATPQRWQKATRDWFASGRAYREFDRIDGTPNPFLQRWLTHPAYDGYWQAMVPYGRDFAQIDIPVLTITGYYDDGQISALHYLKEHVAHNRNAQHYLVIGPYDHLGTHAANKAQELRGYKIDVVAQFSTPQLTLEWMDYVLKDRPKPSILAAAINYEVMGANEWRHAGSLRELQSGRKRFYFSDAKTGERHLLSADRPAARGSIEQIVDFRNRRLFHNFHSYPFPIVQDPLQYITEVLFESAPFAVPVVVSGSFAGELAITINKRDVDVGVAVYEEMPDGKLFHLGYALQRASYAHDASKRNLLTAGKKTAIPFETTFVSKQLQAGSRLLLLLDVSKNPGAQVNYGTGKDVSDETVADAGEPLSIRWHNDSFVDVPFDR